VKEVSPSTSEMTNKMSIPYLLNSTSNATSVKTLYKCPICALTSEWKSNVTRHVRYMTTGHGMYYYPECTSSWSSTYNLKRHFKSCHSRTNPHKCELCSASYRKKGDLTKHVSNQHKSHSTEHK